jgi:polysaccharide biosynthesis protein PslG
MKAILVIAAVAVLSWTAHAFCADAAIAPPGTGAIPDGVGTNIHFTDPKPGEMKMIAEGGFRWLRMDFSWGGTERKKGEYDFAPYDRLVEAGKATGTRFLFILDYTNNLYEKDNAVRTEEGRQAMARWAAAAVVHFKGRGILWEMWNEPNISVFWKPQPNVEEYIKLALAVGEAIRKAAPEEMHVGCATSTIDFAFLEACFKAGLLEHWSAVTVHPYRQQPPETVQGEYRRLRALIRQYAPKGKSIPIISGEWGFSSVWGGFDVDRQGKYLPRQWLTNLSNDVPLSIWYDWHDDGTDPKDGECHFGTVLHAEHAGQDPLYTPKPAYLAARTLTTVLKGYRLNKRLGVGTADDYVLLFARDGTPAEVALAAWTTAKEPREVLIPASAGTFRVRGHTGEDLPDAPADKAGLKLTLTDAPKYLTPTQPNDLLRVAAAWQGAPLDVVSRAGKGLELPMTLTNPLATPIRASIVAGAGAGAAASPSTAPGASKPVEIAPGKSATLVYRYDLPRTAGGVPLEIALEVEGLGRIVQRVTAEATNPLGLTFIPTMNGGIEIGVANPSGEELHLRLELTNVAGIRPVAVTAESHLMAGQKEGTIRWPASDQPPAPAVPTQCSFGLRVLDANDAVPLEVPRMTFTVVDDFGRYTPQTLAKAYRVIGDGDAKVASTQTIALADPPGAYLPNKEKCLRISYDMSKGWKFVQLEPLDAALRKIEGQPKALGMWMWAAGTGLSPRLRFTDATGQTFQPVAEPITWRGLRYVRFPLDGREAGHWGGANDGVVHYPIHWSSILLIDKDRDQTAAGEVYIAAPMLVR